MQLLDVHCLQILPLILQKVSLRKLETKIINYEKKGMIPLTNEGKKLHHKKKVQYTCKKGFSTDDNNKIYHKITDHCHYTGKYRGAAHDICNIEYKT